MLYCGPLVSAMQMRILRYIWQHGQSTVRQIHAGIGNEPGKPEIPDKTIGRLCRFLVARRIIRQYAKMRFEEHVPGRLPVSFDAIIPSPEYEHRMAKWILDSYYNGDIEQFHAALKPPVSDAT